MFNVLDPATTGGSADLGRNPYAWGTDAVDDITGQDDPLTECDENTVLNQGPSAIRDEFTDRFEELLRAVEQEVDIAGYGPLVLEMEDILADQVVVIPLFNVPLSWAFRTDIVGGIDYQAQIGDFPAIFDIDRWYLVDG